MYSIEEKNFIEDIQKISKEDPILEVENGHIISLSLEEFYLESLPESIGNLQWLKILRLRNNDLMELPRSFQNLTALEVLDLSHNHFYTIPQEVISLPNLKQLKLFHAVIEKLPENIDEMKKLEKLNLNLTCVETLPKTLVKMESLKSISLINTNIRQFPPVLVDLVLKDKDIYIGFEEFDMRTADIHKYVTHIKTVLEPKFLLPWSNEAPVSHLLWNIAISVGIYGVEALITLLSEANVNNAIKNATRSHLYKLFEEINLELLESEHTKTEFQKLMKSLERFKIMCTKLFNEATTEERREYKEILRSIRRVTESISFKDKIKQIFVRIWKNFKDVGLINYFYFLIFGLTILIGIYFISPLISEIKIEILMVFLIAALIFAVVQGIGFLPTIRGYVERGLKTVEFFKGVSEKVRRRSSKIKKTVYFFLDILVAAYLVNAIRNIIKIATEVDIIPFTIVIDIFDIIFGGMIFFIASALIIIYTLYSRGLKHLWSTSELHAKANKWARHFIIPLGLFGVFSLVILYYSSWNPAIEIASSTGIIIGSLIYLESKQEFREWWRVKFLFYSIIILGVLTTYFVYANYGFILSVISGLFFGILFLTSQLLFGSGEYQGNYLERAHAKKLRMVEQETGSPIISLESMDKIHPNNIQYEVPPSPEYFAKHGRVKYIEWCYYHKIFPKLDKKQLKKYKRDRSHWER